MIGNRVHRAIVPFGGNRSCARRIAAESKLSDLDPCDLGFPACSIVFVRHLRSGTQGWPDLRSQGRRPALDGHIPDSAGVVWFLDAVEWLACLGRAAADSQLDRWWWKLPHPGLATTDPVLEAFLRHIPEGRLAWNRLEAAGCSRTLEARLGEPGIARLERAWTESGLSGRASGIGADLPSRSYPPSREPTSSRFHQDRSEPDGSRHKLVTDPVANAHRGETPQATLPAPEAIPQTISTTDTIGIIAPLLPLPAPDPDVANMRASGFLRAGDRHQPSDPDDRRLAPGTSGSRSDPGAFQIRSAPNVLEPERIEVGDPIEPSRIDAAEGDDRGLPLASAPGRVFESEFAGLFFVLGALQSLGWIPDFTRPLDRGLGIDPLEYLARLGAHRFGKRFQRDPLCEWLASQFPSKRIEDAPGRLAELESRIGLALDMRPRAALHFLCHRRATILARESRIDVFHRLDDHPLEIRMAGLDRDPGWIPGTCLDFRFHFGSGRP